MQRPESFPSILRDATSIGLGVAAYGVAFGALGTTTGLNLLQTMTLSLVMFTGASQFALLGVLGSGGSNFAAIIAAGLLGFRNLAYAVRMNEMLNLNGWKRFAAAQLTIDESTAMALAHELKTDGNLGGRWAFWTTGLSVFFWWNIATLVGATGANFVGDPAAIGLDAAVAAGFVALLWPQLNNRYKWSIALLSVTVTLIDIPLVAPGIPILIGGATAFFVAITTDKLGSK